MALLIALGFIGAVRVSASGPGQKTKTTKSDSSELSAEFFFRDAESPREIWLTLGPERTFLCRYEREAGVVFSPDEKWIAVNDRSGSDTTVIRLFRKKKDLHYAEVPDAAVSERCWSLFRQSKSLSTAFHLDHGYSECLRWAGDSGAFLVVLWGHTDERNFAAEWLCVYEIKTLRPSMDLKLMNRRSARVGGRTK